MQLQGTLAGVLLSALLIDPASAERASRNLSDVATIENPEGESRFLVNFNPAIDAEHYVIRQAALKFDLTGEHADHAINLHVYPVTSPWHSGAVNWTSGWRTPGGDFDENNVAKATIQLARGAGPVSIDVTRAMKDILENGKAWNGVIMTTDPGDAVGIDSDDVARFSNLPNATIEVSWRKVPQKPQELQTDTPGGQ